MPKLVIVESPTKARTIKSFLPEDYQVLDSRGHIRNLPTSAKEIPAKYKKESWSNLGVNVDRGFEPIYVVSPENREVVSNLKKALNSAEELIIATDEDREGESIGWHIFDVLRPQVPVKRIVFHEITREAIAEAIRNPGELNHDLINAQKARMILDRLVGYTVSPLLWKKIAPKLSAGRVQSVAVRLLVDREKARRSFRTGTYWDLVAQLNPSDRITRETQFSARLVGLNGTRLATGRDFDRATGQVTAGRKVILLDQGQADQVTAQITAMAWRVKAVTERMTTRRPAPPFTTSSLQIEANRKFGFTSDRTMRVAQRLYERGHITYLRTDSVNLSGEAIEGARAKVDVMFGPEHKTASPRVYKTTSKSAQEAHEAIRPAGRQMLSASDKGLSGEEARLYDLIWKRTLATQLRDARLRNTTVSIDVRGESPADGEEGALQVEWAEFQARGTTVVESGFLKLYVESSPRQEAEGETLRLDSLPGSLPRLGDNESLAMQRLDAQGHETKPPARFSEAALVKALVDRGIGRPSTYASIIETIQNRNYAFRRKQEFIPTFTAFAVVDLLERSFSDLVDFDFTAHMESALDAIAAGQTDWTAYVEEFYRGDAGLEVQVAEQEERIDPLLFREVKLENFDFEIRIGRFGPYLQRFVEREGAEPERQIVSLPDDVVPADLTTEQAGALFSQKLEGPTVLGKHTDGTTDILLRDGRYGPYLQLGPDGNGAAKPKRISVPKDTAVEEVSLEMAQRLLSLPRRVGMHPDDGQEVVAHIGRYGPYVSHGGKYANLAPPDTVFDVSLERAVTLLKEKKPGRRQRQVLRELGTHPQDQAPIRILDGRYGPYINCGKVNVSLAKGTAIEEVDLPTAVNMIEERK